MKRSSPMLGLIEILAAFAVFFVASVTFLDQHQSSTARLVNFVACMITGLFLCAIGLITGAGKGQSSSKAECSRVDWFMQELYKHGDMKVALSMVIVSLISFSWQGQPPFAIQLYQMINAMLLGFCALYYLIIQKKLELAHSRPPSGLVYTPSPEITDLVEQRWTR